MPSASPDPDHDSLIGVDPADTRDVRIGGAVFTLGVMTAEQWDAVAGALTIARNEAVPKAIQQLAADGKEPDALTDGASNLTHALMADKEFRAAMATLYLDAVSHSLQAVKGFVNARGEPLPFVRVDGRLDTRTRDVYARNPRIVERLWPTVAELNSMGPAAKKS